MVEEKARSILRTGPNEEEHKRHVHVQVALPAATASRRALAEHKKDELNRTWRFGSSTAWTEVR
ncbi:hypothetical protein [Exiguobacterium qingdaonense]|uniref:hypothetical protein n=1 Tax=Exiguobacterium qingdaonense TaxID=2751251 RepID=UPI001BE91BE6|nr:hypothetical protein [Exiguobacterium qingdaonense]